MKVFKLAAIVLCIASIGALSFGCSGISGEIINALSPVSEGEGVSEAAPYDDGPGPHSIVLLSPEGGKHSWTNSLPEDWRPETVSDTALVVCVGAREEKVIAKCDYVGGSPITRYQYYREVELREARTGDIIAATTLYGSIPEECPYSAPSSQTRKTGSKVTIEQLKDWLEGYVNP